MGGLVAQASGEASTFRVPAQLAEDHGAGGQTFLAEFSIGKALQMLVQEAEGAPVIASPERRLGGAHQGEFCAEGVADAVDGGFGYLEDG